MGKKKFLLIFSIIGIGILLFSHFDIIQVTNNSISLNLFNFSNIIDGILAIPHNLFDSTVSLGTRIIDVVFSAEVLGLLFFGIVVFVFANGN